MFGGKAIETGKDVEGLGSSFYSTVSLGKAVYLSEALEIIKCSHLLYMAVVRIKWKILYKLFP